MQSFLDAYSVLEDYTFKLHARYTPSQDPTTTLPPSLRLLDELTTTTPHSPSMDLETLRDLQSMSGQMDLLADYRRNNWLCVAAMCISLCTSSFFLFILPITEVCKRREMFMGTIDLVSFAAIPFLLTTRIFIVEALTQSLPDGLRAGHKLLNAERVMNLLQCTIHPREKVSLRNFYIKSTYLVAILLGSRVKYSVSSQLT